jgi:hypothetical protein
MEKAKLEFEKMAIIATRVKQFSTRVRVASDVARSNYYYEKTIA